MREADSVGMSSCSSQTGGRLFRATALERKKPPDEQELILTGLAVRKQRWQMLEEERNFFRFVRLIDSNCLV
jgi:hypothetical protein